MGKLINNLSFLCILIGTVLNFDKVKGSEGIYTQLVVACLVINGAIGAYLHLDEQVDATMEDIQRMCKILAPAFLTTKLWLDNQVVPGYWNYVPLVISLLIVFTDFLVEPGQKIQVARTTTILHACCQMYVACNANDFCLGLQIVTLLIAYLGYSRGEIVSGILPFAQYNYVSGIYLIELVKCK